MKSGQGSVRVGMLLATSLFLTGVSFAATAPYRAIVAVEGLGMTNATLAIVITVSSVGTALASVLLGGLSDRISDRRLIVIASAALGGLAYGLIYLLPYQTTYIVAFCLILPFGGTLFSQTFSFSRAYYDQNNPERSAFMMSALRTVFAVAWVIVPPAAGWVASAYTVFDVFAVAAIAHVGCTLIFGALLRNPGARIKPVARTRGKDGRVRLGIPAARLAGIAGVTLVRVAIALHVIALPLTLVTDFGGSLTDVGINAAVAAGLEVPCMLGWGYVATRLSKETILVVNALIYAVYLGLIFLAGSVVEVLWLQGLNAIATAALLSITISYMQEAIKDRVGLSTALMDVVTVSSQLIAGVIFGVLSTEDSYLAVFVAASLLSIAGSVTIALSRVILIRGPHDRAPHQTSEGER